jgi:RNA polymerase sigma-70 factor (ECF subfamily)
MLDNSGLNAADDEKLIRDSLRGDTSSFGVIVQRYWKMAVALALSRVGDINEAEDVAQESFIKAYSQLNRLKDPSRFAGWLCMIVNQQCVNVFRKKAKEKIVFNNTEIQSSVLLCSSNPGLNVEQINFVRRIIHRLPDKFRKVIIMRFVSGLSAAQIAKQLGKRHGTVRVWLHRAYQILRKDLACLFEEVK